MAEPDNTDTDFSLGFLAVMLASALLVLGAVWTYTKTEGIRFMESGYSVWAAKHTLIKTCDLGQIAIFGDSRADSAIIPDRFAKTVTNLGFAGGTPIENFFFVRSSLACGVLPGRVVLSFNPNAFEIIQPWLWDSAARYGVIGWAELSEVRNEASKIGDANYLSIKPHVGIDGLFRDVMYASRFPAIYFNSLVEGRFMFREDNNRAKYQQVLHARGYPAYGNGVPANFTNSNTAFSPLSLQMSFFEKTVALLENAGVETYFLISPHSQSDMDAHKKPYMDAYVSYLRSIAGQHVHFHLLQQSVPVWPDIFFGDGAHLNANGADRLSRELNRCVEDAVEGGTETLGCTYSKAGSPLSSPPIVQVKAKAVL